MRKYEILPEKPDGFAVSRRVLLVADNQLNHLYGDPFWLRNQLFDQVVSVTIRPVQQDLFGQHILKWILTYYGHRIPVIHLGDGTNLACEGEFERFRRIMDTAKQPWVMAPGNHDAYLLGNLHTEKEDWWRQACRGAEGPMTKDRFVLAYLDHLKTQHENFGAYLALHPFQGQWRSQQGVKTFLRAVAYKVDRKKPYRSFEIHRIEDDPDHLIFRTPLFRIPDIWDRAAGFRKPVCKAEQWEVKETDAEDFYLAHNYKSSPSPGKTQKELLVALLNTYKRMLPVVASAADYAVWPPRCTSDKDVLNKIDDVTNRQDNVEMTDLLVALEEFETHRKPLDPKAQRDYCLCQAVWASKYDKLEGRKPVTADPYVRFPKGASGGN